MYNFEQDVCKEVHFAGHNVASIGGQGTNPKPIKKLLWVVVFHVKITVRGFELSNFLFTSIVVI